MGQLDGKIALVTGAARGIGKVIAEKLADEGADLAVCDLNMDWLAETEAAIRQKGRRVLRVAGDVSNGESVRQMTDAVLAEFGAIDILVNNAGITRDNLLVRMSEEDWDAVISVNLRGAFLFTKAVARPMMKARSGAIVNIASIIGLIGNVGQCNYAASKAGLIALTKSVAKELARRNVRVNAVAPGFIRTKMTDTLPGEVQKKMLEAIPLERFGQAEDVADAVVFLAGKSSAYITGQVLGVNGGMAM
ncbi:MAG: 3-oxoacyl-[acyl-carrier-protein] reductase [Lentisphaerae bacterium]|nr:3-oxoacyl-[acyl-carrier-protein] reductase [Lentisphaerota bacterium]